MNDENPLARSSSDRFFHDRTLEVERFRTEHGRWPSSRGSLPGERTMGSWLSSLRTTARGKNGRGPALTPERRALLDEALPGWNDVRPHGEADDELFLRRVNQVAAFRAQHGRFPRVGAPECDGLGTWLTQLGVASRGQGNLAWSTFRANVLDERLPGWRGGAGSDRRGSQDERFRLNAESYVRFIAQNGRRPRANATGSEKQLAMWLARARAAARGSSGRHLSAGRRKLLDAVIPDWNTTRGGRA